jgi:Putative zinc-finger
MMTEHLSLARLSDLADDELTAGDAAAAEDHLATCVVCRGELARLRALLGRAAALPTSAEPPAEAWQAVRARLVPRSPRNIGTRRDGRTREWGGWTSGWGLRAAAAVLLVVASSAVTAIALRTRVAAPTHRLVRTTTVGAAELPASARVIERSYAEVVDELTVTLDAQRGALAPATIATLERTLRVIDQAIAEARAAVAADPANGALLDVLSADYQQKVELLRRASELPART